MIGFETDLQDLRDASGHLGAAADAAEQAHAGVRKLDVPTAPEGGGIFDIGAMMPVYNVFGRTLGMPAVSQAFEKHREQILDLIGQLQRSTRDTSHALLTVADMYAKAEADAQASLHRAAQG
ncbi:hypothetical protein SAMN05421504_105670 [Amycolatopsis xylanica]|uniref:Excreted virulence factor EspC, type VII ESX diderm n=1 Tax=Amycolatopsis xylanica TaxID=589385 RepID=A0A1H3K7D9_9PSEU|nr:hypothetical protein [Amycolatopsis xylanica]SDY47665.1 hypothetical protein SAMN05421504_105670 [Amycolatopsis xylanica]